MQRVVVVGASLAGVHAAQALRRQGYDGTLTLVGDEPHLPYDRPPLSKDFLAGTTGEDRLRLRPAVDPDALGIDWMLGRRAVDLEYDSDHGGGRVGLDDDEEVPFDGLIIATGARARTLPAGDSLSGVQVLRTLDESKALRHQLQSGPDRVIVVGAGFIGAEVAATAREQHLAEVTIVEMAETPMSRVLDPEAGMAIAELHRQHGVEVRLGAGLSDFLSEDGTVTGVELTDGTALAGSVVVVGIGVIPSTEWLEGSELIVDDGVVADETCLAGPGVVVAGDVARWANRRFDGRLMRVEQWDNAVEMGAYAGKRLLAWSEGADLDPFQPVPWFWSDQYDRKIQLAGVVSDRFELVQGTIDEQRFVQLYFDDSDDLTGALCWNRPRQAIRARSLIADRASRAEAIEKLS